MSKKRKWKAVKFDLRYVFSSKRTAIDDCIYSESNECDSVLFPEEVRQYNFPGLIVRALYACPHAPFYKGRTRRA